MPDTDISTATLAEMRLVLHRLDEIDKKLDRVTNDHESRLRDVERTLTQLQAQVTYWQMGQAAWTTLAAAVAGVFGRAQ